MVMDAATRRWIGLSPWPAPDPRLLVSLLLVGCTVTPSPPTTTLVPLVPVDELPSLPPTTTETP